MSNRYAVMLHATNLVLREPTGACSLGGLHTWRHVSAPTPSAAIAAAIEALRRDPIFQEEVWNTGMQHPLFEVEEVVLLDVNDRHAQEPGSALVFYIDTDSSHSDGE
jgi:hypothetical protein